MAQEAFATARAIVSQNRPSGKTHGDFTKGEAHASPFVWIHFVRLPASEHGLSFFQERPHALFEILRGPRHGGGLSGLLHVIPEALLQGLVNEHLLE